jgi:pimeloyl-ACP methyl ester carboxylesterase
VVTYVLIPGAGGDAWYWHRVEPLLRARGHDVVAVELPSADPAAGLPEYVETTLAAIGDRTGLVLVAQSMGGFTAPLVCERIPVELLILLAAMVPTPGESGGEWWGNTGQREAARLAAEHDGRNPDFDLMATFLHDVPPDVVAEMMRRGEPEQSDAPFSLPWPATAWPDVPSRFLLCRDDRLFPVEFQRRVVRERLGITADEMGGGHLPALARPEELVERLEAIRIEQSSAD